MVVGAIATFKFHTLYFKTQENCVAANKYAFIAIACQKIGVHRFLAEMTGRQQLS